MQISLRRKRSIRRSVADNCEAFPKSLPAEPMAVWEASRSDAREAAHNQEACRAGFKLAPPSAHIAREIFLWVIRPPRRPIRAVSANAIQRFLVANFLVTNDLRVIAPSPWGRV